MASDVSKIELGPAIVEYGTGVDKISFETTIGGVNFTVETTYREQKIDQKGETIVSKRITGRNVSVTVPFAEYQLNIIPKIMGGAEIVTGTGGSKVNIKTGVGLNLVDLAKTVIIKPVANLTDPDFWVTMPLAYPETDLQYNFNNENERITSIVLRSTPDDDDIIAILGDDTIVSTTP